MTIIVVPPTTSNSSNFSVTRDDIIRDALETMGFTEFGDGIDPNIIESSARKLNMMVKAWMASGAHLWAMSEATLFLTPGVATYSLGPTGAHCSNAYVQSSLSVDTLAGATALQLSSITGMNAGDNIGILLADQSIQWTTIVGAPGVSTNIAAALTGNASAGAVVFTYTARINRPQRIDADGAYWRSPQGSDTPVFMFSRDEYAQLANKRSGPGKVVQAYYNPQLTLGLLSVWPTPDSATDVLRFWYERPLEDFDAGEDAPDFPIEWARALYLGLAAELSMNPRFKVSIPDRDRITAAATGAYQEALSYDRENVSVFFQPDSR